MERCIALVVFVLLFVLSQTSFCWTLAITNEQGVDNAEPSANNNINTITNDKTLAEDENTYTCFPWIFNPGNFLMNFPQTPSYFITYRVDYIMQ